MTLERKKNSTPSRRQVARTGTTTINNNNNTQTSSVTSLSVCPSGPVVAAPVNNNVRSSSDAGAKGSAAAGVTCPISANQRGREEDNSDEPINSRNTPSSINVLTSGSSTAGDQFANRYQRTIEH